MSSAARRQRPNQRGREGNDPRRYIDLGELSKALGTLFKCCKAYGYNRQQTYDAARRAYPTVPQDLIEQTIYGHKELEWMSKTPTSVESSVDPISRSPTIVRRSRRAK